MPGVSNYMDNDKVDKYVDLLIDTLLKQQPKLQAQVKEAPEVRNQLKSLLKLKLDIGGKGATVDLFREKKMVDIVAQYATMAMSALGIKKQEPDLMKDIEKMLEPLFKDKSAKDNFMKEFKKLFDKNPNPKQLLKEFEALLKLTLGEKGFEKIMKDMQNIMDKRDDAMEKCGLPKPRPSNPLINLLGLISNEPGSYFAPQDHFAGNGNAFVDYNPNQGIANIDLVNSITKDAFGDPLSLISSCLEKFASIENTFTSEFSSQLNATNDLKPSNRGPLNTNLAR